MPLAARNTNNLLREKNQGTQDFFFTTNIHMKPTDNEVKKLCKFNAYLRIYVKLSFREAVN